MCGTVFVGVCSVDDVRRVGDSIDVVCFEFCVLPTALLLGQSPTNWCLCRTVFVGVCSVDDVRRVGDSVDVVFRICVLPTAFLLE